MKANDSFVEIKEDVKLQGYSIDYLKEAQKKVVEIGDQYLKHKNEYGFFLDTLRNLLKGPKTDNSDDEIKSWIEFFPNNPKIYFSKKEFDDFNLDKLKYLIKEHTNLAINLGIISPNRDGWHCIENPSGFGFENATPSRDALNEAVNKVQERLKKSSSEENLNEITNNSDKCLYTPNPNFADSTSVKSFIQDINLLIYTLYELLQKAPDETTNKLYFVLCQYLNPIHVNIKITNWDINCDFKAGFSYYASLKEHNKILKDLIEIKKEDLNKTIGSQGSEEINLIDAIALLCLSEDNIEDDDCSYGEDIKPNPDSQPTPIYFEPLYLLIEYGAEFSEFVLDKINENKDHYSCEELLKCYEKHIKSKPLPTNDVLSKPSSTNDEDSEFSSTNDEDSEDYLMGVNNNVEEE